MAAAPCCLERCPRVRPLGSARHRGDGASGRDLGVGIGGSGDRSRPIGRADARDRSRQRPPAAVSACGIASPAGRRAGPRPSATGPHVAKSVPRRAPTLRGTAL
jgi:hypothetical protein